MVEEGDTQEPSAEELAAVDQQQASRAARHIALEFVGRNELPDDEVFVSERDIFIDLVVRREREKDPKANLELVREYARNTFLRKFAPPVLGTIDEREIILVRRILAARTSLSVALESVLRKVPTEQMQQIKEFVAISQMNALESGSLPIEVEADAVQKALISFEKGIPLEMPPKEYLSHPPIVHFTRTATPIRPVPGFGPKK